MSYRSYYDTSKYAHSRDYSSRSGGHHHFLDKPTSVTAKYLNSSPSYKTSSIPILNRDRSATREDSSINLIASRYANYNKANKEESRSDRCDNNSNKLTVPSLNRSREVSPASSSSKYSLTRSSRNYSPDEKAKSPFKGKSPEANNNEKEKDIPNKTEKLPGYNSMSSYKLYPRSSSSYLRTTPRSDISSKFSISNKLAPTYLKSSSMEKPMKCVSPTPTVNERTSAADGSSTNVETVDNKNNNFDESNITPPETVITITRHTSPTPPGSSVYVRARRADKAKTIENTVRRKAIKPEMVDKEVQSERFDDSIRSNRLGCMSRTNISNWSGLSAPTTSYTGYAGRYSTQYAGLRDNYSSERSSRSRSKEPLTRDSITPNKEDCPIENKITVTTNKPEIVTMYKNDKDDETSEIIINVNLKLKKASNQTMSTTEMVSPEIIITNSMLPPQPPKNEMNGVKKTKTRKSSLDSSSDSSTKKKVVKKKIKTSTTSSASDSEQNSDSKSSSKGNTKSKTTKSKSSKSPSSNTKHSKNRESNSPESSTTISTQSSISEDEPSSKSKSQDLSRTSADEISIPTDNSKQSSPIENLQKGDNAEEAKSFLIRALAPVTNLFKTKHHDSGESKWLESSTSESTGKDVSNLLTESDGISKTKTNTDDIIASTDDNLAKLKSIRLIDSGEKAWWLESESNKKSSSLEHVVPKIRHIESGEKAWWMENSVNESESNDGSKIKKSEESKPWWLDSNASVPDGVAQLTPSLKSSLENERSDKYDFFKVRKIGSGDKKDWWLTSSEKSSSGNSKSDNKSSKSISDQKYHGIQKLRRFDSDERPWWLSSSNNIPEGVEKLPTPPPQKDSESSDSEEIQVYVSPVIPPFPIDLPDDEPLGARRSPEGLETPQQNNYFGGRSSPYENNRSYNIQNKRGHIINTSYPKDAEKYISRYSDIDDILGTSGQIYSPFMETILAKRTGQTLNFDDDAECEEIDSTQVKIHDSTAQRPVIKKLRCRSEIIDCRDESQLDDAALQVYKNGEYSSYLDLDSTIGEQEEELEDLQDSRKNAIILRTQLSVRVHSLIERLLHSQGRELRRALFSLKQVLQSDDDLVHEFVANKGLDCLMELGSMTDHNYLDYVLRALGQILLYVDGMHGVMAHKRCIQWLYSLVSSKFRHVVKTALKLLLVFVEYSDENCLLLVDAITVVDTTNGRPAWYHVMRILQDVDASDTELLIYATNLINKCLINIREKNTYYDNVDSLQEQGMDDIIQLYMSKQGTDLDLLRQLQIFEAVLLYEDGDESGTALKQLDDSIINCIRRRIRNPNSTERRRSKKHQMREKDAHGEACDIKSNSTRKCQEQLPVIGKNLSAQRRRERFARQTYHIKQQELIKAKTNGEHIDSNPEFLNYDDMTNSSTKIIRADEINNFINDKYLQTKNGLDEPKNPKVTDIQDLLAACYVQTGFHQNSKKTVDNKNKTMDSNPHIDNPSENKSEVLKNGNQRYTSGLKQRIQNGTLGHSVSALDTLTVIKQKQLDNFIENNDRVIIINKEHSIKDITQRLTSPTNIVNEEKPSRVSDMTGIVSKAKEELAKSQSKDIIKSPTVDIIPKLHDIKKSENDLHWEELKKGCLNREFHLCDLDFSDLKHDSDEDVCSSSLNKSGIPPPPPPVMMPLPGAPPPPPVPLAPFPKTAPTPPPKTLLSSEKSNDSDSSLVKKNKKTVKLFWKEIQDNPVPVPLRPKVGGFIWDDLPEINLDTKKLEHLFESRSNDLIIKEKIAEPKRNIILDAKRSNAINIAMKKLPTPQTIKAAIMKMDATVIGREGIEKLFTMLPTEEEKVKIQEAQYANPDLPLGSAEQFLLTLASITELSSRLKLWVFKLDFDNIEKEIAEPLMDLKQGIELLKVNKTFKAILSTLRSVGSFLNGSAVKGFRLDYLSKVMEVKDTVHKHPLLYHICEMIIEKFPESSDFFSEVGPVIRASKVDFDMLNANLTKLEADCKASWDHMKNVAKHDGSQTFKNKISEFLTDAAERIILLSIIKKKVMSRYSKFLLYIGVPFGDTDKTKPSEFFKVIAEFALEYRTSRERVLQQLEKKSNHRERNKTRGKLIIEVGNFSNKNNENTADSALKELLKNDPYSDSISDSRRKVNKQTGQTVNGGDRSTEDEMIESLVRSATSKRQTNTRERKRNSKLSDKWKSFNKRTLSPQRQPSWPTTESDRCVSLS